jgi:hypothetical protein
MVGRSYFLEEELYYDIHTEATSLWAKITFKVKIKFFLELAMKAQRGSRGIALLFL